MSENEVEDRLTRGANLITRVKEHCRPRLSAFDWYKYGFVESLEFMTFATQNVRHINKNSTTCAQFVEQFERKSKPVVIQNATRNWKAHRKWSLDNLLLTYGEEKFKIEVKSSGSVKLKFKYFVEYATSTQDDIPLSIQDDTFPNNYRLCALLKDFDVPKYFRDDMMYYANESKTPDNYTFIVGPKCGGKSLAMEPLARGVWCAAIQGTRRWCLFPSSTPKRRLWTSRLRFGKYHNQPSIWFNSVYNNVKRQTWPSEYCPVEILQNPGEIVFVPAGWWSVCLNMDIFIGLEATVCSSTNFPMVWLRTWVQRPHFSRNWLEKVWKFRPSVAENAKVQIKHKHATLLFEQKFFEDESDSSISSGPSLSSSAIDSEVSSPLTSLSTTSTEGEESSSSTSLDDYKEEQLPPAKRQCISQGLASELTNDPEDQSPARVVAVQPRTSQLSTDSESSGPLRLKNYSELIIPNVSSVLRPDTANVGIGELSNDGLDVSISREATNFIQTELPKLKAKNERNSNSAKRDGLKSELEDGEIISDGEEIAQKI